MAVRLRGSAIAGLRDSALCNREVAGFSPPFALLLLLLLLFLLPGFLGSFLLPSCRRPVSSSVAILAQVFGSNPKHLETLPLFHHAKAARFVPHFKVRQMQI